MARMKKHDERRFGPTLRAARERLGFTQTELGALLGVTGYTIRRYELGYSFPQLDRALLIAKAIGSTLEEMIGSKR